MAKMTRAYILIETAVGQNREVADRLRDLDLMKTVDAVTGPFDIIAVAEADSLNDIGDLISDGMHRIPGMVKTITCLSVSPLD
jgi:DNA-binding Lrp family transcriptional regulator